MSINTLYKCRAKLNDEYGNLAVHYDEPILNGKGKLSLWEYNNDIEQ